MPCAVPGLTLERLHQEHEAALAAALATLQEQVDFLCFSFHITS